MRTLFAFLILWEAMIIAPALAQVKAEKDKHQDHQAQKESLGESEKAKAQKCCAGMDKTGSTKEGMPMQAGMKAKMEKMKEMKQKMAEKNQAAGSSSHEPEKKSNGVEGAEKIPHQH